MESKLLAQFSVNFYQLLLQMKWLRWGAATSFYCIDAQFKCWDQMDQNSAEYLILVLTPETSSRFKGWVAGEWTRTTPSRYYSWEYAGALQLELRIAHLPIFPDQINVGHSGSWVPFLDVKIHLQSSNLVANTPSASVFILSYILIFVFFVSVHLYICAFVYSYHDCLTWRNSTGSQVWFGHIVATLYSKTLLKVTLLGSQKRYIKKWIGNKIESQTLP